MRLLQKLENRKNDRNSGAMASAQKPKSFLQKLSSFKPSSLKQRNKEVGDAFKQQILSSGVTAEQLIAASPEIQNFEYSEQAAGLAIGARLVYECAPNISEKAKSVVNNRGSSYLIDRGSKVIVWDAAVEDYLQLDKLYAAQHESGFQLASYYDQKNKNVIWAFGGTDFKNHDDLVSAASAWSGGLGKRVLTSDEAVKGTLDALAEKFNSVDPKTVTHTAYTHSTGIQSCAAAVVSFAKQGLQYDHIYNIEGFGGRAAFEAIAETVSTDAASRKVILRGMTQNIVDVQGTNIMDDIAGMKKIFDPHNVIGSKHGARAPVGGTFFDLKKPPHRAIDLVPLFEAAAKKGPEL